MAKARRLAAATITVMMTMSIALSSGTPAHASAFGCQYIGGFGFTYEGFELTAPQGYLCHDIDGSGKFIDREAASYGPFPTIYSLLKSHLCNWRIDFVYRNTQGTEYRRDSGATHTNCSFDISRTVTKDKTLRYYGTACAQLYVNGVLRGKQCHNITS